MSFIDWELENFPQNFGKLRCNKVIDRQTLTHVICNMDCPQGVAREDFSRVLTEVAETLNKVPWCEIEQRGEWISVKDRLPDKPGHYLVCTRMNYWHGGCWDTNSKDGTTEGYAGTSMSVLDCYIDSTHNWNRVCNCHVTHWMPLPMLPKEERP